MNEQNLNPTIPTNRDIFTSQTNQKSDSFANTKATQETLDKKQIIAQVSGFRKPSYKNIFIVLGLIAFVLFILVLVKTFSLKNSQPQQVNLTWWSLEEDDAAVEPLISSYRENHPNVNITFVKESQTDYRERLMSALAKGKGPDIFEFHNTWVPMFFASLAPSSQDFSNVFYPVVGSDLKGRNGFLGMPLEIDTLALFINQDIFNAYGKNPPKTWDDLRNIAKQLTVRDTNGIIKQSGVALGATANVDYWQNILANLMLQNGADLGNPSTSLGQSALTFYTNFVRSDRDWDETLPNSTTYFINGSLAMYFGPYHEIFDIKKQNPSLHFNVVPVPQLPSLTSTIPSVAYASYWVNGVSKKSSYQSVAWDFLKFMSTSDSLRKLYQNEVKIRGFGNLYPRIDMQSELLTDSFAGPFAYEAGFAKSWYLAANTFDGPDGINAQVAKPYSDAIEAVVGTQGGGDITNSLVTAQTVLQQVLSSYGLVAIPRATP